MGKEETPAQALDHRVRALLAAGDVPRAVTEALHVLGPDVLGFLSRGLGNDADARDVGDRVALTRRQAPDRADQLAPAGPHLVHCGDSPAAFGS